MSTLAGTDVPMPQARGEFMSTESNKVIWPLIFYGTAWKTDKTAALTELALKNGFRAIDTANQPKHYDELGVALGLKKAMLELGTTRAELFIQSKFTPLAGHDDRCPYNATDPINKQIETSFADSLEHFETEYLDSYLLHGPYGQPDLNQDDLEAWKSLERLYHQGKTKAIGISNVSITHLKTLVDNATIKPMTVQNRCYANKGWDKEVREFCIANSIIYQGFSLLTANPQVVNAPELLRVAASFSMTPQQAVFIFASNQGILPLTGTTKELHMSQDLAAMETSLDLQQQQDICDTIWNLS